MTPLQRLARRLGYDLTPRSKAKQLEAQLVAVLERFAISCVLDVGANVGQYGAMLRSWGYRGRIVSFEPLAEAHAALARRAAADAGWQVAPRMALGDRDGEVELRGLGRVRHELGAAAERLLRKISPSSAVLRRETVPLRRLDALPRPTSKPCRSDLPQDRHPGLRAAGAGRRRRPAAAAVRRAAGDVAGALLRGGDRLSPDDRRLAARGFEPYLFLPGYFERKLARQLQLDGVFMREPPP